MILAELTVHWEDGVEGNNPLKYKKYTDLTMDVRDHRYVVQFFAIEGARGA